MVSAGACRPRRVTCRACGGLLPGSGGCRGLAGFGFRRGACGFGCGAQFKEAVGGVDAQGDEFDAAAGEDAAAVGAAPAAVVAFVIPVGVFRQVGAGDEAFEAQFGELDGEALWPGVGDDGGQAAGLSGAALLAEVFDEFEALGFLLGGGGVALGFREVVSQVVEGGGAG